MLSGIFGAIYKDVDKIHRSYIHTHIHIYRRVYIAYKSGEFHVLPKRGPCAVNPIQIVYKIVRRIIKIFMFNSLQEGEGDGRGGLSRDFGSTEAEFKKPAAIELFSAKKIFYKSRCDNKLISISENHD